ncbi:MAG: CAP domain-containing protein [Bacteroidales bacterium]|nr:CAP domain-containing protein [Bacteroidales bacterium]
MRKVLLFSLFILLAGGMVLSSCKKDDEEDEPELTGLEKAKKDYEDHYVGTKLNSIGWTGSEAACNSGDISSSTRGKVVERVNYYRALCGLPSLKLNSAQNASCQDAALIMMANNTLTHTPSSGMKCWTQAGYDAASTGNIAIGWGSDEPKANHSINAVSGYMEDPGAGNEVVGHRAWLLHPPLSAIGTGSVYDANHSYQGMKKAAANCIRWGDNVNGTSSGPEFIAYPPADYVPSVLVFPRWSFALANASFASAKVTVKSGNKTYQCNIIARVAQQGSVNPAARLVWEPQGLSINSDMDFKVTVSDIQGASKTSYTYTVKAFKVSGVARRSESQEGKMLFL